MILTVAAAATLSACVTTPTIPARMHSAEELNAVAMRCGLALGELFQDESEARLLFLFKPGPTPQERSCVIGWARQNGLRPVFINAVQFPES